ncbi:MAG: hypothetical protein AAB343_03535 [Patescibacteria group bacterium]
MTETLENICLEIHIRANECRRATVKGQLNERAAHALKEQLNILRSRVPEEQQRFSDGQLLRYAEEIAVRASK